MVVDASIVVVENIRRHLALGTATKPKQRVVAEALVEVAMMRFGGGKAGLEISSTSVARYDGHLTTVSGGSPFDEGRFARPGLGTVQMRSEYGE